MVSKGYATVIKYRADDDQRSSHYDDLLSAENKALKSQKGIHGKKDHATVRVHEINVSQRYLLLYCTGSLRINHQILTDVSR